MRSFEPSQGCVAIIPLAIIMYARTIGEFRMSEAVSAALPAQQLARFRNSSTLRKTRKRAKKFQPTCAAAHIQSEYSIWEIPKQIYQSPLHLS